MPLRGQRAAGSWSRLQAGDIWRRMRVVWSYPTHRAVDTVAWSSDAAFALVARSRLVSVASADGQERWRASVGAGFGWVALSQDAVALVVGDQLTLRAQSDGAIRWTRGLGRHPGWVHAAGDVVVVGGWRGYTDVVGLDAADGSVRWRVPAVGASLHSTAIVGDGSCVWILDAGLGRVRRVSCADGAELGGLEVEARWLAQGVDLIASCGDGSWSGLPGGVVLACPGASALLRIVDGLRAEVIAVPEAPLAVVPWGGEELVFVSASGTLWRGRAGDWQSLGRVPHTRRWVLPAAPIGAAGWCIGTSEGALVVVGAEGVVWSGKVGKRVDQAPAWSGGRLCVASRSGALVGLDPSPGTGSGSSSGPAGAESSRTCSGHS
jgi:outer membrane protein assembly factor BamB